MKIAISDRGEILHFAGSHSLSPALKEGRPVLVTGPDPARCGWEAFFAAVALRRLALVHDHGDPAAASFVPEREARAFRPPRHGLRGALGHSARFVRELLSRQG